MYLDYDEYTAMGGTLNSSAFSRLEFKARRKVDCYTSDRLKSSDIPDNIKMLMFELVNLINASEENGAEIPSNITSVSNDGYSVAYSTDKDMAEKQIYNLIFTYASEYMYRGIDNE